MKKYEINNNESKQLPEVFKELQAIRNRSVEVNQKQENKNLTNTVLKSAIDIENKIKDNIKNNVINNFNIQNKKEDFTNSIYNYTYDTLSDEDIMNNFKSIKGLKRLKIFLRKIISFEKGKSVNRYICRIAKDLKLRRIKLHQVSIVLSMFTIGVIVVSLTTNSLFAKEDVKIEAKQAMQTKVEFEENENAIDILNVLSDNISVTTRKDIISEISDVSYKIEYIKNDKMPKDEEKIIEPGVLGKKEITYLRTYENDEMTSEEIVGLIILEDSKRELVEIGTSEFLGMHGIHIGERMFLKEDAVLKAQPIKNSEDLASIWVYMDVTLLDFDNTWCKVMYNNKIGYIERELLISEKTMPGVTELSRKQRILSRVDFNMDLSIPSGMSREDFKKVLTDSNDRNKIFENSSDLFYEIEQKYGINGIFVASIGIHESAWGTSKIATSKNNLFGYKAYDRNPYTFAAGFESYESGIDTLAKALCKNYLYPEGTKIYDEEEAKGSYYNGPTVTGVNVRYASDKEWCNKVYKTMIYLYSKLP